MPNQTSGTAAKDYSSLYLPGAIILAGLLIAIGLFFGLSGKGTSAGGAQPPRVVNVNDVKIAGEPFIGKENAPLTMAYWSDFQCPFCKAVDVGGVQGINIEPSFPMIIKDYVDTGKLKVVFKDYQFLGQDSVTAAEYGRAIWALYPDKYYGWREAMYKAQDAEGDQGFGDAASIDALIKKIPGLDAAKIKALVAQKKAEYDAAISADQQEGAKFGIQGTPGFIIGKKAIDGAAAPAEFKSAIDSQL
ncbi:thioredoxin domain-containing protein [Candidatus Kaiserbacteria bacterium]|nr:thioredoxin domain-containing protein [Candidatus Kaiserbacteria bacterium]